MNNSTWTIGDLTTEQRKVIGNDKNLGSIIDKVILPSAKSIADKAISFNREIVKVVPVDTTNFQIRPIISKNPTDEKYSVVIYITKDSIDGEKVAEFTGAFADYDSAAKDLAGFNKELSK